MKPILFNTDMVRTILDNRKTVTRRAVKPQPICHGPNITYGPHTDDFFLSKEKNWLRCRVCGHDPEYSREGSNVAHHWTPPYRPGDILYVRETWAKIDGDYVFKEDDETPEGWHLTAWHPSIHMPREAARIFLRVTNVRVERLKDITELDILEKEGVTVDFPQPKPSYISLAYTETRLKPTVKKAFANLWDSTIKPKDHALYGWEANPWVWIIEFERISKEEAENVR